MIDIKDITPGESYACRFRVRDIPLDEWDRPAGLYSLADVPINRTGDYEGFGYLKQRDTDKRLVVIVDDQLNRDWIVSWDDIWDVDLVVVEDH